MPEFWNDEQKLCTDNNKVYHYLTWPGITPANMIYKTQQNSTLRTVKSQET